MTLLAESPSYNNVMSGVDQVTPPPAVNFGEELRKEREMRTISLKEIADATKVSKRFLEAIERNDFRTLPAPVFTRGFVREYARYLGLNADDMVARYDEYIRAAEPSPSEVLPEVKASFSSYVGPIAFVVVLIALAAGAIWGGVRWWRSRGHATQEAETATSTNTAATAPAPAPAAPQTPASPLHMEIRFVEATWITVESDGKTAINDEVAAGVTRTIDASDHILFKTLGNAGGVELTLNGTRLPSLGNSGDVRKNVRFDKESLTDPGDPRTASVPAP